MSLVVTRCEKCGRKTLKKAIWVHSAKGSFKRIGFGCTTCGIIVIEIDFRDVNE